MDRLKQCPFCGKSVAELTDCAEVEGCSNFETCDNGLFLCVVCNANAGGCGASGGYAPSAEQAIERWNRRPVPENKPLTNFERIIESPPTLAEKLVEASRYQESAFLSPTYSVNGTEYRNRDIAVRDMTDWLNQPEQEVEHEKVSS